MMQKMSRCDKTKQNIAHGFRRGGGPHSWFVLAQSVFVSGRESKDPTGWIDMAWLFMISLSDGLHLQYYYINVPSG